MLKQANTNKFDFFLQINSPLLSTYTNINKRTHLHFSRWLLVIITTPARPRHIFEKKGVISESIFLSYSLLQK